MYSKSHTFNSPDKSPDNINLLVANIIEVTLFLRMFFFLNTIPQFYDSTKYIFSLSEQKMDPSLSNKNEEIILKSLSFTLFIS